MKTTSTRERLPPANLRYAVSLRLIETTQKFSIKTWKTAMQLLVATLSGLRFRSFAPWNTKMKQYNWIIQTSNPCKMYLFAKVPYWGNNFPFILLYIEILQACSMQYCFLWISKFQSSLSNNKRIIQHKKIFTRRKYNTRRIKISRCILVYARRSTQHSLKWWTTWESSLLK